MVATWLASNRMAPLAVKVLRGLPLAPEIAAEVRLPSPLLVRVGLPPETAGLLCVAPIKLRAMPTPMLAAPSAAPAADTAMILALIVPGELASTLSLAALMIEGLAIEAVVSPRIVLCAEAPPPAKPTEFWPMEFSPIATETAAAAAVLSMRRVVRLAPLISSSSLLLRRVRSPLLVRTPVKPEMETSLLPARVLVAVAAPMAGAAEKPLPAKEIATLPAPAPDWIWPMSRLVRLIEAA